MVGTTKKAIVKKVIRKKMVKFEFKGESDQEVHVAGTFNDWDPGQLKLKENGDGVYRASLRIPSGRHEYKFVVNGIWCADSHCPDSTPNAHGSINSVVTVA